jgi:large subunit ribosomal protein L24
MASHIRKDDTVIALSGKERVTKKHGKVLEILTDKQRARVEGFHTIKRHLKRGRSAKAPQGGIIEEVGTIELSNLMVVCPKCNKPSRTGRRELPGGRRARFCKKCNELVD